MSLQSCRLMGVPGAGKTTRAIEIIQKVKERGFNLQQVGFCTFTRSARREASERAAQTFGVKVEDLERNGWFRTIHSACMKLLAMPRGGIVNYDRAWLREALGEDVDAAGDDDDWTSQWKGKSRAAMAVQLWDLARNRLCSFEDVYDETCYRLGHAGALKFVDDGLYYVRRFEKAKKRDGRLDFTDCLLRYAGYRYTERGPERVEPEGDVPDVPVWVFDEAQDTSKLLDAAARRLSSGALWTYLMGDRQQGIYQWGGADPDAFMRWKVAHEEYMGKTWRCAAAIIRLGIRLLYASEDGPSREIRGLAVEPRCEGGKVLQDHEDDLADHVKDPSTPTLVLARTNQQVARFQAVLTAAGKPWKSSRGNARWPALSASRVVEAFEELASGGALDGAAWRRVVEATPRELLQHGTKARYKAAASGEDVDFVTLGSLAAYGGTDELAGAIASGKWAEFVKAEAREAHHARKKWGGLADDPKIVVSTVHGSKGMQADKVVLATGIGGPVERNLRTPEGREEERRVWYVGATRARDTLVLLRSSRRNYEDLYDCL